MGILNTTQALLVIIAVLLVGVIALQAVDLTSDQDYQNPLASDSASHSIGNPVLKQEMQATYQAVGITEFNRGINTWD